MATLTADTVSNILQIVSDWRGEPSTNTDAPRIRAVSRAERDVAGRRFFEFHLLKDQTITSGGTDTETIGTTTFPMRMKGLQEVFVGDTTDENNRYEILDFDEFKRRVNLNSNAKVVYPYYDQTNDLWKLKINPTPASGVTITYSYYYMPPKRTLTTENVISPDTNLIAHLALAEIYHNEDELQKEQLERAEAENLFEELMGIQNAPAEGQTYRMGAVENIRGSKGIGNY